MQVQFSSVWSFSRVQLCDPMNYSTPGLPIPHQIPGFTQTRIPQVSDAIQPSHPLSFPSPPALNPSQHQSLFQWVNSSHEVAKELECVGRNKEEWIQGYEWRVVAPVTHHKCSEVGSYSPALLCAHNPQVCHDNRRYFGQWNLNRGDTWLPTWRVIFCSTRWNADGMTGARAAMLDQK